MNLHYCLQTYHLIVDDSAQCGEIKTFHRNYCSLLSSVDRPGGVHKIRKTLHRKGLPRNMEYKCGSIDKGREVATGSATETKTGVLLIQYRTTVQTDAERHAGRDFEPLLLQYCILKFSS